MGTPTPKLRARSKLPAAPPPTTKFIVVHGADGGPIRQLGDRTVGIFSPKFRPLAGDVVFVLDVEGAQHAGRVYFPTRCKLMIVADGPNAQTAIIDRRAVRLMGTLVEVRIQFPHGRGPWSAPVDDSGVMRIVGSAAWADYIEREKRTDALLNFEAGWQHYRKTGERVALAAILHKVKTAAAR